MGHLTRLTSRVATASIALAAAACPAHALEPVAGVPYASVGDGKPLLVPGGGVAVFEGRPHEVRLNEIDPTTGARDTMFRRRLDRRVFVGAADLSVAGRVAGGRAVVSLASLYTTRDEFFHPLGGQILSGAPGSSFASLHSCSSQTHAAPIDLDGALLASADRTSCGARDFGEEAKYDVVARDLAAGTTTTLVRDVIVADEGIRVAAPYVALATGPDAGGEGYADRPDRLRVFDVRTGAVVTDIALGPGVDLASAGDVWPDGRLAVCAEEKVQTASPGAAALAASAIPCRDLQALPDGRVVVVRNRQLDVADPANGGRRTVIHASTAAPGFDTDGTRIAWTDTGCRDALVHHADLATVAFHSPRLSCPSNVGATVSVRGRTARTTLSCPNGCTGSLQLYKGSVNTDPEPLAQADVDPPPGVRTRVTIRLSRSAAAKLSKAGRVNVTLFVEATSQYRARSRRVKHG